MGQKVPYPYGVQNITFICLFWSFRQKNTKNWGTPSLDFGEICIINAGLPYVYVFIIWGVMVHKFYKKKSTETAKF